LSAEVHGVVLLVAPPPTPNGPLHLGHLSGPYVASDIAARALRAAGRTVLTQCGLDAHQNYVLAKAEARGEPAEQTAETYSALVRQGFAAARIEYDILVDPLADAEYRRTVSTLLTELVDSKVIDVAPVRLSACQRCGRTLHHARVSGICPGCRAGAGGGTCEGCGQFLTAAGLDQARSTCCTAAARPVEYPIPVLRLEEYRDRLCQFWSRAVLPPRLRRLIAASLDRGLPEVPLAYPTDWGIPWSHRGGPELRIDVWAEMALANLFVPARRLRPGGVSVADCLAAWAAIEEQWIFLGLDNAFYYAVLIPALHIAAGLPDRTTGLIVNEFYRLTGSKFSTSRDHAIWVHELLRVEDCGAVRAFVSWDRPDRYQSDFTMSGYRAFHDQYVQAALGRGGHLTGALAEAELVRGESALQLDHFDPAVAVRAALATAASCPERAGRLLGLIAGTG
jgi:methionyl-tRNA synthetase